MTKYGKCGTFQNTEAFAERFDTLLLEEMERAEDPVPATHREDIRTQVRDVSKIPPLGGYQNEGVYLMKAQSHYKQAA